MNAKRIKPIHPGEVLDNDFLKPLGVSRYGLAKSTHVAPRRINEIVKGTRAITADTALRLSAYFGTTAAFWLNLQVHYDLEVQAERLGKRLSKEVMPYRVAA
jgi:addiction module HigA family antidote